jgi:hypothetical protein
MSRKKCVKRYIRDALGLKYEPLTFLKIVSSTVSKLRFFKSTFHQSKNALTRCPGPRLNLIPGVRLIFLIEMQCAHARVSSSAAGPLAICGRPIGDYSILRGRLLSEKTGVDTYISIRPGPFASY